MANVQIGLTPELVRGKAKDVRDAKTKYDDAMSSLRATILSLNEVWAGDSQTAFVERYESVKPTLDNFSEMIENYASDLDFAASKMEATDQELTARSK